MTKRFGFTLAEVLITLGIIGVVAAMTIPTLINGTNQAQFKTGIKKMMSTLNQAITMNMALNDSNLSSTVAGNGATTSLLGILNARMNVVNGGDGTLGVAAVPAGSGADFGNAGNYTIFFNDGMGLTFPKGLFNCKDAVDSGASGVCDAEIDINGVKGPNVTATANSATTNIQDRYSVRFEGNRMVPNSANSRYVLSN